MCKPASFKVTRQYKALFHPTEDSHNMIECHEGLPGTELNFVPVEISPPNGDLSLPFSEWVFVTDLPEKEWPSWYDKHSAEEACRLALPKWEKKLEGANLHEAFHPVNPLLINVKTLSVKHKKALEKWASVGASVGDSVRARVRDSVWASVGDSVWDSVWAYTGGLFPNIAVWRYAEKLGSDPWRPLLTLWYDGYVPSFDDRTWRLHCGRDAKIVYKWTPKK